MFGHRYMLNPLFRGWLLVVLRPTETHFACYSAVCWSFLCKVKRPVVLFRSEILELSSFHTCSLKSEAVHHRCLCDAIDCETDHAAFLGVSWLLHKCRVWLPTSNRFCALKQQTTGRFFPCTYPSKEQRLTLLCTGILVKYVNALNIKSHRILRWCLSCLHVGIIGAASWLGVGGV